MRDKYGEIVYHGRQKKIIDVWKIEGESDPAFFHKIAMQISDSPVFVGRGVVRYSSPEQVGDRIAALVEVVDCYPGCQNLENLGETAVQENSRPTAEHPLLNVLSELWALEELLRKIKVIFGQRAVDTWGAVRVLKLGVRETAAKLGYAENNTLSVRRNVEKIDAVLVEALQIRGQWI